MATTASTRSQDCLRRPNNSFLYQQPLPFNPHPQPNPNPKSIISRPRKRGPLRRNQGPDRAPAARFQAKNLVMGQVKILKRGEELRPQPPDLVLGSTDRLGPDPETVQEQIRVSDSKLYAGTAVCLASPPPSSLPFPAFSSKKNRDTASRDLRRLLRLDTT